MRFPRTPDSLSKRMRNAQTVLVVLMLVPALLAISLMWSYSQSYHNVIEHISDISSLRPTIENELLTETMDIATGRKRFDEGNQHHSLNSAQNKLDLLITSGASSSVELEVSRRLLGTLASYVEALGESETVDEQFALNDEINNVSMLFLDMLQEAVNAEIADAALASKNMQVTIQGTLIIEILLVLASLIFAAITENSLSKAVRIPLDRLERFAGRIAGGELDVRAKDTDVAELHSLTHSLNTMAFKLQNLMEERRQEQENLKKSELRALQAQITPHFLYNTLDAIIWLAEAGRTQQVIEITNSLSDFFRISLNNGKDWVSIAEEWQHLQGYLTIQKIRYRDILRYELTIDDALKEYQMLKLLIQPLVENAIYHGIKNRRAGGKVRVEARLADTKLLVSVFDNGIGMDDTHLKTLQNALSASESTEAETGYGLYSVDKRIKLYYGQSQGLTIQSTVDKGTIVSFCVPLRSL